MNTVVEFKPEDDIAMRTTTLLTMLMERDCIVTFTKVNGETRTMPCTLREEVLPPLPSTNVPHYTNTDNPIDFPKSEKKPNLDVMSVWCTDQNGWRSFRIMNVTKLEVVNNEASA